MASIPLNLGEAPFSYMQQRETTTTLLLAPTVYAVGMAAPPPVTDPAWKVFGLNTTSAPWDNAVHGSGSGRIKAQLFEPLAWSRKTPSLYSTPPQQAVALAGANVQAPHRMSAHAYYLAPDNFLGRWRLASPPAAGGLHFTADIPCGFTWPIKQSYTTPFEAQATMVVQWLPATAPPVPPSKAWLGVEIARSNTVSFSTLAEVRDTGTYPTKRMTMDVTVATADLPHPTGYITYGLLLSVLDPPGLLTPGDLPVTAPSDMPMFHLHDAPLAYVSGAGGGSVVPFITMETVQHVASSKIFAVRAGGAKPVTEAHVVRGGKLVKATEVHVVKGGQLRRVL